MWIEQREPDGVSACAAVCEILADSPTSCHIAFVWHIYRDLYHGLSYLKTSTKKKEEGAKLNDFASRLFSKATC